jgi:hypothetical protein
VKAHQFQVVHEHVNFAKTVWEFHVRESDTEN